MQTINWYEVEHEGIDRAQSCRANRKLSRKTKNEKIALFLLTIFAFIAWGTLAYQIVVQLCQ